ncbi:MAG: heme exporter protein CcmB [Gemmatimonadetes bacterium]|nr:heme exporter protein CcmB [Gemmatimonadota bacterium]
MPGPTGSPAAVAGESAGTLEEGSARPAGSLRQELRRVRAMVWKDLTAERRSKATFNAVAFLAALILLLFGFALGPDNETVRTAAGGVIWLTILFSGVLAFNRSYEQETEEGALDALLLYPGDRRAIFAGKLAANFVFVLLVEAVLVPVAMILYDLPLVDAAGPLAAVIVLGTLGFVTLGTFYASMASRSRAREVLLPLLLFPMLIPLLIGAVEATGAAIVGDPLGNSGAWLRFLIAFDVIFVVAALFAFEHVIEG